MKGVDKGLFEQQIFAFGHFPLVDLLSYPSGKDEISGIYYMPNDDFYSDDGAFFGVVDGQTVFAVEPFLGSGFWTFTNRDFFCNSSVKFRIPLFRVKMSP